MKVNNGKESNGIKKHFLKVMTLLDYFVFQFLSHIYIYKLISQFSHYLVLVS